MTQFFEGNGAVATVGEQAVSDLIFGVDSASPANVMLQNNLSMLEWVTRNKVYPVFWGRNLNGDGCLAQIADNLAATHVHFAGEVSVHGGSLVDGKVALPFDGFEGAEFLEYGYVIVVGEIGNLEHNSSPVDVGVG